MQDLEKKSGMGFESWGGGGNGGGWKCARAVDLYAYNESLGFGKVLLTNTSSITFCALNVNRETGVLDLGEKRHL